MEAVTWIFCEAEVQFPLSYRAELTCLWVCLMQEVVAGVVRAYMGQVDRLTHQPAQPAALSGSLASDTPASNSIFDALAQACSSVQVAAEPELMLESGAVQSLFTTTLQTHVLQCNFNCCLALEQQSCCGCQPLHLLRLYCTTSPLAVRLTTLFAAVRLITPHAPHAWMPTNTAAPFT